MKQSQHSAQRPSMYLFGALPIIWLALLIAPYVGEGLIGIVKNLDNAFSHPFHIELCEDSLRTILVLLLVYGFAVCVYLSSRRNYRQNEEHGSAKWGDAGRINRKYVSREASQNKILTRNVSIGLDGRKHRRNLNVLVCGGSGSGKTRFYAKANLLNAGTSFIALDPKGELLRDTGGFLASQGYAIKVIDLINMERSHGYNPFVYLRTDADVFMLVTNLFQNTTPKNAQTQDPFWDNAAHMLLLALIFYLLYEAPPEEQNFAMVMDMIRAGDVKEENENYISPLDRLFQRLENRDPGHIAVKCYHDYKSGAGKTLKSIQITLVARLEKFNLDSLASLTMYDELELDLVGERKTAIFAVIPDNDTSFNFVPGMLYTQLFQLLFRRADRERSGRLPVHVHFLMDEFSNVALPSDFAKNLATMRSREVSVSIIIQNMAQLKALFEKEWENLVGNCDEFLYLGGNELSTHEYVSKLLGKETIYTKTFSRSRGRNGSYSTNWQLVGRELMTPDEVRMLDNSNALLFIRGERPVMDEKYDILKHPNILLTTDGGGEPYIHGADTRSAWAITVDDSLKKQAQTLSLPEGVEYELLSDEEILAEIELEEKQHENNEQS